jgi:hypothetical protein
MKNAGKQSEQLIYMKSVDGHGQSYFDLLGPMYALSPVTGQMSGRLFQRLVNAKHLLFASLDQHMFSFAAISIIRSVLGRPTVALFLRAQRCFEYGKLIYPIKRFVFWALRRVRLLTVVTITPFEVAPRYAEVARAGVCDPQYWDLHDGITLRKPGCTSLSDEVRERAGSRRICCVLGALGTGKGLGFLAGTLERHPQMMTHAFIVCAGRVMPGNSDLAARLLAQGALLVDRFISDAELESLYGIADAIWACYAPDYDEASGVFGRAIQWGVPVIVREGSVIAAFADRACADYHPVAFDAHESLAAILERLPSRQEATPALSEFDRTNLVGSWRRQFDDTVRAGLEGHHA